MAKKKNFYHVNGERVPGVTTVVGVIDKSAPLMAWAVREAIDHIKAHVNLSRSYTEAEFEVILNAAKSAHRVRKESAGDFGTNVHEIVEAYIGGQLMPDHLDKADEKRALENFILETKGWKWLASEIVLLSEEHLYGGTADGLAIIDEKVVLVDFKTSKGIYPTFDLQLAMYAMATPERDDLKETWKRIEYSKIVHLNQDRITWQVVDRDLESQKPYIEGVRSTYQWKRNFDSNY